MSTEKQAELKMECLKIAVRYYPFDNEEALKLAERLWLFVSRLGI